MDVFPEKCFPCRYQKDSLQMQHFGGLGSNKNIDVADSNVQDRNFSSQHVPFESEWYCASGPALPLSSSPARVPYPFEDRVAKEFKTQRNDAEIFCKRLKTMRAGLKKSRNTTMQKSFKDVLEQLESINQPEDSNSKVISVSTWIEDLVKQYEKVKDIQKVKNYNSKYTGGCLSRLGIETTDGKQLLISPTDHNFNSLALLELNTSQVSITQKHSVELGYELFQLLSKRCRDIDYSVTRGEEICEVFTHQETSEDCSCLINSVGKESFPGESLTSVDLSVYIPAECVMATNEGNFYLWTPGQSRSLVRELQEMRFPSHESWRQVMFGSHPRHIVMADSTAVQLTDIRGHSSASVDLFALPNKLFNPAERLCLVEKHPSSHHAYLIASNRNMLLMDDRFPGCPMLQWNHMLRKPPQVASSIILETDRVMVAMGSLTPAEVFAYQYRYGLSNVPQSLGSPWRFSHFGDFTDLPEMCNPLHKFAADQRFESSLTGISLLNTQSGFTLIQLDSQGELYYQEFEKSSETREVRFCGGPGCGEVSVDRLTVERGKKWTRDLHDYINTCKNSTHKVNVTDVFSEITLNGPGHVSCPLCMPDTCDLQLDVPTAGLCYSCGHLISDAKAIAETKYNNIVQSVGMIESDQETSSIGQMSLCPLGEILLHQWNEDTEEEDEEAEDKLIELLRKRNEDIKERRKNLKKTVSVTLQQEVSTTEESQISSPLVAPDDEEQLPDSRELQDVIARYTRGNGLSDQRQGLSDQRQIETPVPVAGGQDSCDERDDKQVHVCETKEADGQSLSDQQRTDMMNVDESEFSSVFVSQVERDYPFMKQSPRKRMKTSHGSDHVSNFSSISQWSDGFLATPPRLLSQHSTVQDRVKGSADKSEKDTHDGSEVGKFGRMCSSPQLPVSSYGRTRHYSLSNSISRQSVKSNISVQSDGFRTTPSRLHILNSPARRSRGASPDLGSTQSSVSDLNSSIDLFDPDLKAFDLLKSDLPMGSPMSRPTNSQTDSQSRKKVKKQLMTGF